MFTGIVECLGQIEDITKYGSNRTFIISSPISNELSVDQSIAHDGVCLTVEEIGDGSHRVTLIKETLDRSTLGSMEVGSRLNLERCMKLSDRVDGHLVQGHVDDVLRCRQVIDHTGSKEFLFELPEKYHGLVVMKGSISLNGVSLTISHLEDRSVGVSIIPFTFEHTTFQSIQVNDLVNVEFDLIGKYVARSLVPTIF